MPQVKPNALARQDTQRFSLDPRATPQWALDMARALEGYLLRLEERIARLEGSRGKPEIAAPLDLKGHPVQNAKDPSAPQDVVTLAYFTSHALVLKDGKYTLVGDLNASGHRIMN